MRFATTTILCFILSVVDVQISSAQDEAQKKSQGGSIYHQQCAECHGKQGQGGDSYSDPLSGDLNVEQLAKLIRETMPEDDPGSLTAAQSQAVSQFVFESFYSKTARLRLSAPRIELSHLTVPQYRRSVMDLAGTLTGTQKLIGSQRGLTGEYFATRRPRNAKQRELKRVDHKVDFDFGTRPPIQEIEDPRIFSIRWSGSVLAPDTGIYTVAVRSQHAVKLFVNSPKPRIDAWVKSTGDDLHVVDIYLIGGQWYPLVLEFSKSKQGVDDSKKQKEKPPVQPAAVSLEWKRPRGVMQTIPTRYLSPTKRKIQLVCETPFPADDRSYGWIRTSSVSRAWDQATTSAALDVMSSVMQRLDSLLKKQSEDKDDVQSMKRICKAFMESAFRTPLNDAEIQTLINTRFEKQADPRQAVKQIIVYTLKSPRFLFRETLESKPLNVASRLSFGLWNSIPDRKLLQAAASGQLETDKQIRSQADRMLSDPRAKQKLRGFLLSWLQVDMAHDIRKDLAKHPGFDAAAIADMRESLELLIDEVISSEAADYRYLLTTEQVYMNARMAALFDVVDAKVSQDDMDKFNKVNLDADYRSGVLTHPYLLAQFSYRSESSPIHRGVFMARNVLGTRLRPPPEAFAPLSPQLHAELTTRERVTLQTRSAECMSCHKTINPLGFALENFDAVGRFRKQDRGKPINARSTFSLGEQTIDLENARQLARFVINNPECQTAFCEQLFHFMVGQSINAYGSDVNERLRQSFVQNEYNIRRLAEEIMVVSVRMGHNTTTFKPEGLVNPSEPK